jgi:hypothetical protein
VARNTIWRIRDEDGSIEDGALNGHQRDKLDFIEGHYKEVGASKVEAQ